MKSWYSVRCHTPLLQTDFPAITKDARPKWTYGPAMTMISNEAFSAQLQAAIEDNSVVLPTLPEVALQVRDAVEQDGASAQDIADLVATDAALSARLLQVANSPLYGGKITIDSIQMAITRLGTRMVRTLVVNLAMKQIFQPTTAELDQRLRQLWGESVQVAALSRVLAQQIPHLERDQAMLAGLIHNIGSLPILIMAENFPELIEHGGRLDSLLADLAPAIGRQILETWNFPDTLISVPAHCADLAYDSGARADYVDLVQVATLECNTGAAKSASPAEWAQAPAFAKVGLNPEVPVIEIEGIAEQIDEVEQLFEI